MTLARAREMIDDRFCSQCIWRIEQMGMPGVFQQSRAAYLAGPDDPSSRL